MSRWLFWMMMILKEVVAQYKTMADIYLRRKRLDHRSLRCRQRLPQSKPYDNIATNKARIGVLDRKGSEESTVSRRAASLRTSYDSHHERASQGSGF
jgi:hypothetical protein